MVNHMKKINKVFCGSYAMYSNGTCLSLSGSATAAILAKKFRKPFYVLTRGYEFSSKNQIDSFTFNQSIIKDIDGLDMVSMKYDVIPCKYISLLVTEIGLMPSSTVPVIIREFETEYNKISYEEF